ncbi:unnamed protein product [Caenorhabditis angaria]|uniref:BTB domain-containing protein n=1 Tax=Caenorhabditis angaria TaxID=860376 RepID=A0A9P1MSD3_9PELO|nr:unnamed protein product [Caenorhabditis angaria]
MMTRKRKAAAAAAETQEQPVRMKRDNQVIETQPKIRNEVRLQCTIADFSKKLLPQGNFNSEPMVIDNLVWKFFVARNLIDGVDCLDVFLVCDMNQLENADQCVCVAEGHVCLIQQTINIPPPRVNFQSPYTTYNSALPVHIPHIRFVFEDVLRIALHQNDSIIICATFDYKFYDFSKYIRNYTDVTLCANGKHFFVNKGLLSSYSKFFFDLFYTQDNSDFMIDLEDIQNADLSLLLANLLCNPISVDIMERILPLAYKFDVLHLKKHCERAFIFSRKFSMSIETLQYIEKYDLEEAMKYYLMNINPRAMKPMLKSEEFNNNLKESTKLRVFASLLDHF